MRDLSDEGSGWLPVEGLVSLDEAGETHDMGEGTALSLRGSDVLFDGKRIGDATSAEAVAVALTRADRERADLFRATHPSRRELPRALWLLLRSSDPWPHVAALIEGAARSGFAEVAVLFERRGKVAAPRETPTSRALQAIARAHSTGESTDPSTSAANQRHDQTASEWKTVNAALASCSGLERAMASGGERAGNPSELLATPVANAVQGCGCNVDFEALKSVFWQQQGRYDATPKTSYRLSIAPQGSARVVEVSAATTDVWRLVAPRVVDAAKAKRRVAFVVR